MKKILLSLALVLIVIAANSQTQFDVVKLAEDGSLLKGKVSGCDSANLKFTRTDVPGKILSIPFKTLAAVYVSDSGMKNQICKTSPLFCQKVSQKNDMVLAGSNGVPTRNNFILSDSLSRVALSYHLDRAGYNLNASNTLGFLAVAIGLSTIFTNDLKTAKAIGGVAFGVGIASIVVRYSGGKHLMLAGQKIRYRK
jgi:hypothetical protein